MAAALSWTQETPLRVLVAARLSRKHRQGRRQDIGRGGISIETQDQGCRAWAERQGYTVVAVVADTKSGTIAPWDRPNLSPWVTDPELMVQYDAIVAFKNDRLSRQDWADEARIRMWAEEHGKRLIIVDGPQWPPRDQSDRILWDFLSQQSRSEWKSIQERNVRTQTALRDDGKAIGRCPWGYEVVGEEYDKRFVPTEAGRKYIPLIFALCINGMSTTAIAAWLDSEGISISPGKRMWPRSVAVIIQNPTYAGRHSNAEGRIIHECEPLIGADTYIKANQQLQARNTRRATTTKGLATELTRRSVGRPVDKSGLSMLTPVCPWCHWDTETKLPISPMNRLISVKKDKSGTDRSYVYYRCLGIGARRKGCGNMVHLATVDKLVSDFLDQLDAPMYILDLIAGKNYDADIALVDMELKSLASQGLSEEKEDDLRTHLRAEKRRLAALPSVPDRVERVATGQTYGEVWHGLSPIERRAWLAKRGVKCYAAKTAKGTIQAAFPGLLLQAMGAATLLEADGVSVILTWLGSGIDEIEMDAAA